MNPLDPKAQPEEDSRMVSKAVSAYMSRTGKLARGVPKHFTPEDLARRAKLAKDLHRLKKPKRKKSA